MCVCRTFFLATRATRNSTLCGAHPFDLDSNSSEEEVFERVKDGFVPLNELGKGVSESAKDLISRYNKGHEFVASSLEERVQTECSLDFPVLDNALFLMCGCSFFLDKPSIRLYSSPHLRFVMGRFSVFFFPKHVQAQIPSRARFGFSSPRKLLFATLRPHFHTLYHCSSIFFLFHSSPSPLLLHTRTNASKR